MTTKCTSSAPVLKVLGSVLEIKANPHRRSLKVREEFEGKLKHLPMAEQLPLVALVDEVMQASPDYPDIEEYRNDNLGMRLLKDAKGLTGDKFYKKILDLLKQDGNISTVQVYYLCLVCGFEGKYDVTNQKRREIVSQVANYLREAGCLPKSALPEWPEDADQLPVLGSGWPPWTRYIGIGAVSIIVLLFLFNIILFFNNVKPAMNELLR